MKDRPQRLRATLERNARDVLAALTGTNLVWHLDRSTRTLSLATEDRGPKEVVALELQDGDRTTRLELAEPVQVPGRFRARQPVRVVTLPADVPVDAVRGLVARNLCGGSEVRALESASAPAGERASWDPLPARAALPGLPPGASADEAAGLVRFGPGTVELDAPLSLPRGWRVRFEPATELVLGAGVHVEIRGDLVMAGTADAPVLVRPAGNEPWGAFAVLGERAAPLAVELAHTTFRGGAGSNAGSVRCTGSVALYFTTLTMDHVTVEQNTSEDAINPKFSAVRATDCLYRDGASDAVDYDFCTGTDLRTRVERFGNDGIDVSGSRMRIEGAVIRDVGDKGLSVGEGSQPEYVDVTVIGPHTGVAIKDRSAARFERLTIVRADTAVAQYVKKTSFGPSQASFRELVVVDSDAMLVLDQGCAVTFEDSRRVGSGELRVFEGVENVQQPGVEKLSVEELLELAHGLRVASGIQAPER